MNKQTSSVICLFFLILVGIIPVSILGASFQLSDEPWPGFSDNTVIDIAYHNNAIWTVTGSGLSFSSDGGINWLHYDVDNGLFTNDIASIYSDGSRLWLGLVAPQNPDSGNYLAFTDDDGFTWDTLLIDTAYEFTNPIFDITGDDSLMFFASKVGGLFGSFDNGTSWRNIYYSIRDSVYKNNLDQHTNHYFSAAIDTFHNDSVVVWGGTAHGLMRYVFAPEYARLNSNNILNLSSGGGLVFIGGDSGLSSLSFADPRGNFSSTVVADGLPGLAVASSFFINGRLFVGTLDSLGGEGSGLAVSDDTGLTFNTTYTGLDALIGPNKYPVDFVSVGDVIFMAGFEGGLYKTADTGNSWTALALDADPTSGRNIIHSLALDSTYLWIGTDSGLVRLTLDLDNQAAIVNDTNIVFTDTPSTGGRAAKVKVQKFYGDDDIYDSTIVWTILHPLDTAVGTTGLFYAGDSCDYCYWEIDGTKTGLTMFDIEFVDSLIFLVGHNYLATSPNRINWLNIPGISINDSTNQLIANFSNMDINDIEIVDDTIYLASQHGLAVSPAGSLGWKIFLSDKNPQHFSSVDYYTFADSLTGDFTPVLAVQGASRKIWASTRPGPLYMGANGISSISLDGNTVEKKYEGSRIWNFAFDGQNVFAASDDGLLFSDDDGATWDTLSIKGTLVNPNNPEPEDLSLLPVYGVKLIGNTLWVGTDDGVAFIDVALAELENDAWNIVKVIIAGNEVYAFPTPFSPYDNESVVKFRYPVWQAGNVTIEVFDFAMNLVKTVTNNAPRLGGTDADDPRIYQLNDEWDGTNDWGQIVAVGMYYFKISYSTGETYWGKLAIMP